MCILSHLYLLTFSCAPVELKIVFASQTMNFNSPFFSVAEAATSVSERHGLTNDKTKQTKKFDYMYNEYFLVFRNYIKSS